MAKACQIASENGKVAKLHTDQGSTFAERPKWVNRMREKAMRRVGHSKTVLRAIGGSSSGNEVNAMMCK